MCTANHVPDFSASIRYAMADHMNVAFRVRSSKLASFVTSILTKKLHIKSVRVLINYLRFSL